MVDVIGSDGLERAQIENSLVRTQVERDPLSKAQIYTVRTQVDAGSRFQITLPTPIKSKKKIVVTSLSLSKTYYNISNGYFDVTVNSSNYVLTLDDGFYTRVTLAAVLDELLNLLSEGLFTVTYSTLPDQGLYEFTNDTYEFTFHFNQDSDLYFAMGFQADVSYPSTSMFLQSVIFTQLNPDQSLQLASPQVVSLGGDSVLATILDPGALYAGTLYFQLTYDYRLAAKDLIQQSELNFLEFYFLNDRGEQVQLNGSKINITFAAY